MKTDNGYPYNFNLQKIEEMVAYYLADNRPQKALDELTRIKDTYFENKEKIDYNVQSNEHLMGYLMESLTLDSEDPTKVVDFFHFELIKMINEVREKTIEKGGVKNKTVNFVALYLYYSKENVSNRNVDEIARGFGFKNGGKLIQEYNKFQVYADRTADPESKIKLKNKIKLFEEVKKLLAEPNRKKVDDELGVLKSYLVKYQN